MATDFSTSDEQWQSPIARAKFVPEVANDYEVPSDNYNRGPSTNEELNAVAKKDGIKALVGAFVMTAGLATIAYTAIRLETDRVCLGVGCKTYSQEWSTWVVGGLGIIAMCAGLAVTVLKMDSRKSYRQSAEDAASEGYVSAAGYGRIR